MSRRTARAFTLIELLVVIAIIAILAAILFPVFAQAREKARQATCVSNAKQIGLGISMYAQDFDEMYPFGGGGWGYNPRWDGVIMPYVKNGGNTANTRGVRGMWMCPSRPSYPSGTSERRGYGCNSNIMMWQSSRSMAEIPTPAGTFIAAEGSSLTSADSTGPNQYKPEEWPRLEWTRTDWQVVPPGGWANNNNTNYATADTSCNQCRRPMARHNGGMTVVYCDGHVKWAKASQFLNVTPANPKGWPYGHANNSWDNR
jgi:prepilin-type N-terminal cleavage/methylation domain-containing protein/prepilin-type processing-associated H-X9-DG protein